MRLFILAMLLLSLESSLALAEITSGPKVGDAVEDFKVLAVLGTIENKQISFVKERKGEPTIYIFVQREHFGRPEYRFLRKLDTEITNIDPKGSIVGVWLAEKSEETKAYLERAKGSLQFANTAFTVFEGEKSGPNRWGVNPDAHLTVVICVKDKVVANFAYESVNETDAPKVLEALKKSTGKSGK